MTAIVELVRTNCECHGNKCNRVALVPKDVPEDLEIILDGCLYGPEPTQKLVETHDGYRLFTKHGLAIPDDLMQQKPAGR